LLVKGIRTIRFAHYRNGHAFYLKGKKHTKYSFLFWCILSNYVLYQYPMKIHAMLAFWIWYVLAIYYWQRFDSWREASVLYKFITDLVSQTHLVFWGKIPSLFNYINFRKKWNSPFIKKNLILKYQKKTLFLILRGIPTFLNYLKSIKRGISNSFALCDVIFTVIQKLHRKQIVSDDSVHYFRVYKF